jgi:ureidoglycolate lyase
MTAPTINVEPFRADSFVKFGHVVSAHGVARIINQGRGTKWDRLVPPSVFDAPMNLGLLELDRGEFSVSFLERHLLTFQVFIPMSSDPFIVVVGTKNSDGWELRAFRTDGTQGVSFSRSTWHAPLLPLAARTDFVSIQRESDVADVEYVDVAPAVTIDL